MSQSETQRSYFLEKERGHVSFCPHYKHVVFNAIIIKAQSEKKDHGVISFISKFAYYFMRIYRYVQIAVTPQLVQVHEIH